MRSVEIVESWPVTNASVAVISADGDVLGSHGDLDHVYRLASVTKLLTSYAVLVAVEEGVVELDDPAGPDGATVRHLLAHAGGYDFSERTVRAAPGARRIYSNVGFEVLGETVEARSGIVFADYVRDAVLVPLGMTSTSCTGSPAAGASSTVNDLVRFASEVQHPTLLHPTTVAEATSVVFPGLVGVVPGFGRQTPNDWGLGFEIRDGKSPHWTGATSSPRTFGHFGQSGTFVWVDPDARLACVALTDRDFGPWAAQVWPVFTDGVLAEVAGAAGTAG
ncbi:serine hydrolase domain-containing protein [Sanguibacter antarcticus]|uniref:CubicO group peptidase (Beta-lactamase class C family) n=1 Tax=Sanguibacter antarcticus TaxID=372484 RepID=A0A2A9E3D8_9MICO|nr:serine hydrolase domain-containing protein [Sanguibacter antarcticus]PFG33333.1 CubicO group peptidase (beta-lactamase class C family) [Sanguibacter antarcticus]